MNELPRTLASSGGAKVDRLEIGGLTIDLRREELRDTEGRRIDLRNRSFGVLRHLATNAGRVVTKDELLGANWPGVTVTEDSLTQCISEIRRALGDAGRDLIRTVPRRGYMVVLPERTEAEADLPVAAKPRKSAWYRNPRTVAPALFGAALLAAWGAWTLTRGTGLPPTSLPAPTMASSGPTVAVLPFENATADSGQDARADGLTQAMISALSRFGELRVLTRGATSAYKGGRTNVIELRRALGVDYAVDGSLLRDGDLIRIDIRLSDARTGAQVWSRTFKTPGDAADRLASQDDISDQASAMIASYWGAIGVAEYKRIQTKSSVELKPYECIVQGVVGTSTNVFVPEPVRRARDCLETLTRNEPRNAAAWAALILVFDAQRNWGFALPAEEATRLDKRLYLADKAVAAANLAIELAPNKALIRGLAARAAWMACQPDLMRIETRRSIALNPNDPQTLGPLGVLMAASGFWEEGTSLAEKGIALTAPSTPRWWWWATAERHWFRGEYPLALDAFRQSFVEQLWLSHLQMAYTLPFLGQIDEARAHVATLLKMQPQFTVSEADAYYRMWCFSSSYREKMRGALRAAGLPE